MCVRLLFSYQREEIIFRTNVKSWTIRCTRSILIRNLRDTISRSFRNGACNGIDFQFSKSFRTFETSCDIAELSPRVDFLEYSRAEDN